MSEKRQVNLHFLHNDQFVKFSRVCSKLGVNFQVRRENDEWYITTEPLAPTVKRKLISTWADASMERITDETTEV